MLPSHSHELCSNEWVWAGVVPGPVPVRPCSALPPPLCMLTVSSSVSVSSWTLRCLTCGDRPHMHWRARACAIAAILPVSVSAPSSQLIQIWSKRRDLYGAKSAGLFQPYAHLSVSQTVPALIPPYFVLIKFCFVLFCFLVVSKVWTGESYWCHHEGGK